MSSKKANRLASLLGPSAPPELPEPSARNKRNHALLPTPTDESASSSNANPFNLIMRDPSAPTEGELRPTKRKKTTEFLRAVVEENSALAAPDASRTSSNVKFCGFKVKELIIPSEMLQSSLKDREVLPLEQLEERASRVRRFWRNKEMFNEDLILVGVVCHIWRRNLEEARSKIAEKELKDKAAISAKASSSVASAPIEKKDESQGKVSKASVDGEMVVVRLTDLKRTSVCVALEPRFRRDLVKFGNVVALLNPKFVHALDGNGVVLQVEREAQICVVGDSSDIGICRYRNSTTVPSGVASLAPIPYLASVSTSTVLASSPRAKTLGPLAPLSVLHTSSPSSFAPGSTAHAIVASASSHEHSPLASAYDAAHSTGTAYTPGALASAVGPPRAETGAEGHATSGEGGSDDHGVTIRAFPAPAELFIICGAHGSNSDTLSQTTQTPASTHSRGTTHATTVTSTPPTAQKPIAPLAKQEICPNFIDTTRSEYCDYHMFIMFSDQRSNRMVLNDPGGGSLSSSQRRSEISESSKHLSDGVFALCHLKWKISTRNVKLAPSNDHAAAPSATQMYVPGGINHSDRHNPGSSNDSGDIIHQPPSNLPLLFFGTKPVAKPLQYSSEKISSHNPRGARNLKAAVLGIQTAETPEDQLKEWKRARVSSSGSPMPQPKSVHPNSSVLVSRKG